MPSADGERGELVVTNLGRAASPLIRYRTGDVVVRRTGPCACGRTFARLEGGILARVDDMVNVRGVNVYPSAVEAVVRRFDRSRRIPRDRRHERVAARVVDRDRARGQAPASRPLPSALRRPCARALGLTVPLRVVEPGTLPRFEMKARRFVIDRADLRNTYELESDRDSLMKQIAGGHGAVSSWMCVPGAEFDAGHVPGAIHIPFWQIGRHCAELLDARDRRSWFIADMDRARTSPARH